MDNNYIGKIIDNRYEVISLIGVGGMSNVYKAIDTTTGDTVAIKFLKQEFFSNEELVRRFKNESKAISLLDNPNIIRVIDVNIGENEKYIVVEYIDGITLKDYIDNRKVLTWQETVRFTGTVLAAIGHAHDNGIIHRDMKPQNIMLLRDGTLKIMDFGIARLSTANQKTVTDKAIGSVHYISPEQVRGKNSDGRSDIYSIGIMMYEMLTGKLPFVSDTAVSVAMKQVSDIAQKPSEIVNTIPQGLEQIVMKAIEKNANDRYQSAAEMIDDLNKFKANPAIVFDYGINNEKTQVVEVKKTPEKKTTAKKVKVKKNIKVTLPVMAGVAAAFLVSAVIAVFMIFKISDNPILTTHEDIDLPNFVGMTETEIKEANYNLKYDIEYIHSGEYEAGVVFAQTPKPPKLIKENGTVKLKISKGPMTSTLKDLANYSRSDAEKILSDMDVNVAITTVSDKNIRLGYVVKTEPVSGSVVSSGDTVTLYISKGDGDKVKTKVNVPQVTGLPTLEEASKVLAVNDLRVGSYTYRHDGSPEGTVLEQNPAPGTEVVVGRGVDLVISKGPETCDYCDSTGHTTGDHPMCGVCGSPDHDKNHHECSVCGVKGHEENTPACPKYVVCSSCGKPGHADSSSDKCDNYAAPTPPTGEGSGGEGGGTETPPPGGEGSGTEGSGGGTETPPSGSGEAPEGGEPPAA